MKRARLVFLLAIAAACHDAQPAAAPGFELTDVVAAKLAELGTTSQDPAAGNEAAPDREELIGLLDSLQSSRGAFRDAALEDMRSRASSFVAPLGKVMQDAEETAELRAAAVEALAAIDTPAAVEILVVALKSAPEAWLRSACAWQLSTSKHDQFLPRLLLRLRYETDEEVAVWLGECLAKRGNYSGIEGILVVRNRARTPELVALAEQRLAEIATACGVTDGEVLSEQWKSGELEARLGPPKFSPALEREVWTEIQGLAEWNLRFVDDHRFALTHMNNWVVEPLARTLHDKNVYLRVHAAQCLERMGARAKAAGPELVVALTEPRLVGAAAEALGSIGYTPAAEPLEKILAIPRNTEAATAAARALGKLGLARSIGSLRAAFAEGQPSDLRQAAAEALLRMDQEDQVVPFLVQLMTAPRAESISAEQFLGEWLERKVKSDPARFVPVRDAWRAADVTAQGAIATRDELQTRLAVRAKLLSELAR